MGEPGSVVFEPRRDRLQDGTEVLFRLLGPDDGPLLVELFLVLSEESIFNRFLMPVHHVDQQHLKRLVEIDQWNEVAIAVLVEEDGLWRIVAVARYHRDETDPTEAEIAIIVGDPWQGLGIGGALLKVIEGVAVESGVRRFTSAVNPGNRKLIRFCDFYGYKGTRRYMDGLLRIETEIG